LAAWGAAKLNRYVTHIKRLKLDRESRAVVRDDGGLGLKLAVVLVQLPPRMRFDEERADRSASTERRARHRRYPAVAYACP